MNRRGLETIDDWAFGSEASEAYQQACKVEHLVPTLSGGCHRLATQGTLLAIFAPPWSIGAGGQGPGGSRQRRQSAASSMTSCEPGWPFNASSGSDRVVAPC